MTDWPVVNPPDMVQIPIYGVPTAQTNWSTYTQSSTSFNGGRVQSSGAQDAEITFPFTCRAGTYTLAVMWNGASSYGIANVRIDGASIGTLDEYQVSSTATRTLFTALALAAGTHAINLKMETKNGSSSSYIGAVSALIFTRTGA